MEQKKEYKMTVSFQRDGEAMGKIKKEHEICKQPIGDSGLGNKVIEIRNSLDVLKSKNLIDLKNNFIS